MCIRDSSVFHVEFLALFTRLATGSLGRSRAARAACVCRPTFGVARLLAPPPTGLLSAGSAGEE
eukprot:7819576-Alexandrium_andersonii.AAC.1